ncbi:MAG TPA: hypothetical protein VMB50_20710 [Myxococcales bacterium]|nr:hypothetical protein [Myxococcales bacterium]
MKTCEGLALRFHVAQLLVENLADVGLEPFQCEICLELHVKPLGGRSPGHSVPAVSVATARGLRLLRREVLDVLGSKRREGRL